MRRFWLFAAAVMGFSTAAVAQPQPPVEVMVLGTWHFDNPGADLHNVQADDVLTPRRQAELNQLAEALATFRPTKIMVENEAGGPDLADSAYGAFVAADLAKGWSETVQIAYRLAHQLGHRQVYAIDHRGPQYFPFGEVAAFAEAHGQADRIGRMMGEAGALIQAFTQRQADTGLAELLIDYNDPAGFYAGITGYYGMLAIGNAKAQPGANLNAMWYLRSAKIFTKLMNVAEPGDRILVVFGGGHSYWLRHFAGETPGFKNVDPAPYLRKAARQ